MVQTDRNQQTVEKSIDTGPHRPHVLDAQPKLHQSVVNPGPDSHQHHRQRNHGKRHQDGHQAAAAEKRQGLVQLHMAVAVVKLGRNHAGQNAHKLVVDLAKSGGYLLQSNALYLRHGRR